MASAIVRYGGPVYGAMLAKYGMRYAQMRYKRAAVNIARWGSAAWRNRKTIKAAYKGGKRKYRQVTKWAKRMKVEQPRQKSQAVQDPHVGGNTLVALGTLDYQEVKLPLADVASNVLGTRVGLYINLKGIRFCRQFEFLKPSEAIAKCPPIILHWAVVQLKDADMDPALWKGQMSAEFFRSFNEQGDRHTPFVDNGAGSAWGSLQNCCRMNPDTEVNILTHRRKKLTQRVGEVGFLYTESRPYVWQIDKYIKIKKRIGWSNISRSRPTHPIIELYWYQTQCPSDYPSPGNASVVATWKQHTVYYTELKA